MGNYQITVARSCDWETVYAAKLTCFPFERRDYKPFAQGRLCLCPEGLHVQLISFEVKPLAAGSVPESSCLTLALGEGGRAPVLRITADSTGRALAWLGDAPAEAPEITPFAGEDLQGIYWGVKYCLGQERLGQVFARPLEAGRTIWGNLVTSCLGGDKPFFGTLYPTIPQGGWLEKAPELGEMELVEF